MKILTPKEGLNLKGNSITPTQLLLNYLCAVGGKEEYNKLLLALDEIVVSLNKKHVRNNVVFHGCRTNGNIRGETISNELWYWISNGFIKERYENYEDIDKSIKSKLYLEFTEKANNLLCQKNIENQFNRNLPKKLREFLNQIIHSTISSISEK